MNSANHRVRELKKNLFTGHLDWTDGRECVSGDEVAWKGALHTRLDVGNSA